MPSEALHDIASCSMTFNLRKATLKPSVEFQKGSHRSGQRRRGQSRMVARQKCTKPIRDLIEKLL